MTQSEFKDVVVDIERMYSDIPEMMKGSYVTLYTDEHLYRYDNIDEFIDYNHNGICRWRDKYISISTIMTIEIYKR